jgi:hypothetical protein
LSSATTSNDHSLIDWSIMRACCHSRRSDGFALLIALVRHTAPRHLGAHWHGAPDLLMLGLLFLCSGLQIGCWCRHRPPPR